MILSLERISKRYHGSGGLRVALDDVSLELERGQVVGVFGPSGSGKTTLLRIAAGLQTPDSGAVLYNGTRLDRMGSAERMRLRRREIACVWAQPPCSRLSVLDHVALPLLVDGCDHRGAKRRAREALLACEADQCAHMELQELSDGERQRVAIAGALVIEPRLLLADGPASSLSLVEQEAIMVLLSSLAREAKVAVLIADSDIEALIRADPVLYLSEGKLVNAARTSEYGRVYQFPGQPRRAAADA
ncbi:MAG TPA: ATP-binding cassette domain-containing protein [Solirubrobacteraceae bacterium]|jgi:ABC-type lipoprotein export system ATPase subunit|nr:ATP-binding cassette domain-containing protein [Solirubrobacteraceae bacterium]